MAKPSLPDPIERRTLLWSDGKKPVDHAGLAERYLQHGRKSDAIDFAGRATDAAKKAAVRASVLQEAVAQGDAFLLGRLDAQEPVDEASWRAALENAKKAGMLRYALRIARRINDEPTIRELDPIVNPPPPPGALPAGIPPELLAALSAAQRSMLEGKPPGEEPAAAPLPAGDGGAAPPPTT